MARGTAAPGQAHAHAGTGGVVAMDMAAFMDWVVAYRFWLIALSPIVIVLIVVKFRS